MKRLTEKLEDIFWGFLMAFMSLAIGSAFFSLAIIAIARNWETISIVFGFCG